MQHDDKEFTNLDGHRVKPVVVKKKVEEEKITSKAVDCGSTVATGGGGGGGGGGGDHNRKANIPDEHAKKLDDLFAKICLRREMIDAKAEASLKAANGNYPPKAKVFGNAAAVDKGIHTVPSGKMLLKAAAGDGNNQLVFKLGGGRTSVAGDRRQPNVDGSIRVHGDIPPIPEYVYTDKFLLGRFFDGKGDHPVLTVGKASLGPMRMHGGGNGQPGRKASATKKSASVEGITYQEIVLTPADSEANIDEGTGGGGGGGGGGQAPTVVKAKASDVAKSGGKVFVNPNLLKKAIGDSRPSEVKPGAVGSTTGLPFIYKGKLYVKISSSTWITSNAEDADAEDSFEVIDNVPEAVTAAGADDEDEFEMFMDDDEFGDFMKNFGDKGSKPEPKEKVEVSMKAKEAWLLRATKLGFD